MTSADPAVSRMSADALSGTVRGAGAAQTPLGAPAPLPGPQGGVAAYQLMPDAFGAPPEPIELRALFDASTPPRGASDPSVMRGDLPRHLSFQIVEAIQQRGMGQRVEFQLNPVELGKVSMQLQMVDNTAVVHILADRPETLDLMRRHIELLAQDFRAIGYGDTKFSFSGSGRQADARQDGAEPNAEGRSHAPEPTRVADNEGPERPDAIAADRLDIRL